jgi:lipopolysaccharide biosynthesis regulator YciM
MQKAKEGGATTPKLAVIVEESSLLSGLRSFLGRLLYGAPMEESAAAGAAAEAAAAAAAKAAADRQLAANLAANLDAERVYKTQEAAATEAAAAEAAAAAVKAAAAETRKNRYKLVRCKCCTFSHFALCDACPRCHDAAPRG